MSHIEIAAFLKQKIGMDANTVSPSAIASAIRQRMRSLNLTDERVYYRLLQSSGGELQEFIDVVTVPETCFLRDREPFTFLKHYITHNYITHKRLPQQRHSIFRVLSVPCASGEEPYSITITLMESGLSLNAFQVEGIDVSQKMIQKATRGVYTMNSFRMTSPEFQARYFTAKDREYELHKEIRDSVRFSRDNILDPQFGIHRLSFYNVIFCRNLLIYFDQRDRDRALQRLHQMLANDGILFVGHSEMGQIPQSLFEAIPSSKAYAYRKLALCPQPIAASTVPIPTSPLEQGEMKGDFSASFKPIATTSVDRNLPNPLEEARKLADRGLLQEAISIGKGYLERHRTDVEAYVLLAQIYQAQGSETEAMHFFQRALYLNPKHDDALFHLYLLKEKMGDRAGAEILRQRLQQ
ncbi:CheR family methyltransferase [Pseudanabaena sp. UWO310]|uniref:CheR family methyltransferase n=1 Tax=Pseudanabaena sp. UWO310 TaxID=2480795 RepID=UPI001159C800|nr:protein-glutamate O-methyltransferase CheR [Pseudanabaena sp. UWO310]TYQ31405.1 chemotaxis protein CheR [Pseudanabaena sp. UWO310]